MRLMRSIVFGLARVLEEKSFVSVHPRFAEHGAYGKELDRIPGEVRLSGLEYHGPFYHLRREAARAGLYFIARCSLDYSAREMAREKLKG